MTYEELLAKIDAELATNYADECGNFPAGLKALRAVVELHKPFQFEDAPDLYKPVCRHCQLGVVGDVYPCETIVAIDKELNG